MLRTLVGVDGCTGGWIAAIDKGVDQVLTCERFDSIGALMQIAPQPSIVAIDVPIGLLERGTRECDAQARRLLGVRRNSVFTAPIRPTLSASSHGEASSQRFAVEGKKLSLQAWGIMCKVAEIDAALRAHPPWRACLREVHPELCFYHLNGWRPMAHPKKGPSGRNDRLALLRREFAGAVDAALGTARKLSCKPDDVVDAFVALWTARRIAAGTAVRFPSDPPFDPYGLPMEMVA